MGERDLFGGTQPKSIVLFHGGRLLQCTCKCNAFVFVINIPNKSMSNVHP